jgi:hypothetical protein
MAKNTRREPPANKHTPETKAIFPQDDPPLVAVFSLRLPGAEETCLWAIAGEEDKALFVEALNRIGGSEAILHHLASINLPDLLGPRVLQQDVHLRPQDISRINEALVRNSDPEVISLLLAEAVVFSMVKDKEGTAVFARISLRSNVKRLNNLRQRYRKGPEERSRPKQERHDIIRRLLEEGVTDTKKIWGRLKKHKIRVELHTVQNDLSQIRKG